MVTIFKSKTEKRNGHLGFYCKKVSTQKGEFDVYFHSHEANVVGLRVYNEKLNEIPTYIY